MDPAGAERHRRSPEGELSGASESIEPARRKKGSLSNETERNIEAGVGIEPIIDSPTVKLSVLPRDKDKSQHH
jgi:hypothetical protein